MPIILFPWVIHFVMVKTCFLGEKISLDALHGCHRTTRNLCTQRAKGFALWTSLQTLGCPPQNDLILMRTTSSVAIQLAFFFWNGLGRPDAGFSHVTKISTCFCRYYNPSQNGLIGLVNTKSVCTSCPTTSEKGSLCKVGSNQQPGMEIMAT